MNGVSVGAVHGARVAYDIHHTSNNQENQDLRKVSNGAVRQRSTSNLRAPLSNLPAGRTESSDYGPTSQQRSYDRAEGVVSARGKGKKGLDPEHYEAPYKRKASNGNLNGADTDDIPENMYRPEREEAEGWIHREKLAKIENEELQAAGINLAKARSKGRDTLGDRLRTSSRDRLRNDFASADGNTREEKRRIVSSPIPTHPAEEEDDADKSNWDLRPPEEIATDQDPIQNYTTPVLRKSGSKIPVLSPATSPTPPESSERDTPISRKRTMSGSLSNEGGLHSPKLRVGSSKWTEDVEASTAGVLNKSGSPTKTRQPSTSGGQAPSPALKSTVPRKTSTTTKPNPLPANGRPRTRGNDTERPRTAVHPPEGDPPWLADMYKPDPRLPPDQQLIPTLAKKRQQMQWEQEGLVPKTYDRDFTAIAVHENNYPVNQLSMSEEATQKPEDLEWPLKPLQNPRATKDTSHKPTVASSPTVTGGYSTMPKVSSPPISVTSPKIGVAPTPAGAPSPNIGSGRHTSASQQQSQRIQQRLQLEDDDEKAQKKGCGCCVVM